MQCSAPRLFSCLFVVANAWLPLLTPFCISPPVRASCTGTGIHPPGACLTFSFSMPKNRGIDGPVKSTSRTPTEWPCSDSVRASCVVTLDFPALIDRLMHRQDYEACLLGLSDIEPDPDSMMNIWLSSSPNHQWNPSQKTPATPWEAEIDREMRGQSAASDPAKRKAAIDRVQGRAVGLQVTYFWFHLLTAADICVMVNCGIYRASGPRVGGKCKSVYSHYYLHCLSHSSRSSTIGYFYDFQRRRT